MTEPSSTGAPWRPPLDLGQGPLAGAAVRLLRVAPSAYWKTMAALVVLGLALDLGARRLGVPMDGKTFTGATWTYLCLLGVTNAAVVGVALHVLLTGRTPPRIEPGLLGFVLWTVVADLFANTIGMVAQGAPNAPPAELLPRFLLVSVGGLAGLIVFTRLMLLPIAWLVADPGATAARSWARMKGQVLPYMLASIVLSLPGLLVGVLAVAAAGGSDADTGSVPVRIVTQIMVAVLAALSTALSAVVYLRRVGAPERLADVFD